MLLLFTCTLAFLISLFHSSVYLRVAVSFIDDAIGVVIVLNISTKRDICLLNDSIVPIHTTRESRIKM